MRHVVTGLDEAGPARQSVGAGCAALPPAPAGGQVFTSFVLGTAVALAVVLFAEQRGQRAMVAVAKPIASLGFLGAALVEGAIESDYGRAVFAALVLSFFGDVFLIGRSRRSFLLGLVSFLLGHVGYAVAFAVLGVSATWCGGTAVACLLAAAGIGRWILPHTDGPLKGPVVAYIGVISAMVVLAFGAYGAGAPGLVPLAAVVFFLSDITVARDRFVAPGFENRVLGLPAYYGAQLCFAATVGLVG